MLSKYTRMPLAATTALGLLLAAPASFAGGAMSIVPNPEGGVPQGDQIPLRRIETIERRVDEFNAAATEAEAEVLWPPGPRDQASTSH